MKNVVGKMPLVVMKFVGAKYGNKNVKMIFWGKMMLCSDEIFWGKIVSGNLPPVPQTTTTVKRHMTILCPLSTRVSAHPTLEQQSAT